MLMGIACTAITSILGCSSLLKRMAELVFSDRDVMGLLEGEWG